jgi:hypothetical protein
MNGCGGATLRTGSLRVGSIQASFELACMFLWEISMTHDDNDSGPVTFVDMVLVLLEDQFPRRSWSDEEIDQVRDLLIANPVETVASKIGRSTSSVRQLCGRLGIRVRELRCDLFSVNSLAAAMHVRKTEVRYWIEQGWLEAVRKDQGRSTCYNISPEALQRCLREHLQDLQKRNIRSATILAVFNQFCYVPKHTVGEQLRQVREAKREQAAYVSANLFESGDR